ncbi:N-acetyl-lysine deacetylase [Acidianus sulfidivorans JP7]|uniref:[LysW]-lysine/[LysW]-ornithine hydrolase n=1 Tax=Acidianus sulfidivorans JP7 TaxID=619593 RepID=A0A2U9IN52_9CREN|nr:N-acetyl-lysine deacetylase [Acidianus sulfidivorans]AWR97374.1 N-acetyl-lysine deacetylase [Acidianus sulfidivorans JP7]
MQLEKEYLLQKAKNYLLELTSIYTPSGEESKALPFFEKISKELNLELKVTKSNSFLLGDRSARILLASHVDTVSPFVSPREENDTIYGRGVVDAKGPLISMLLSVWLAEEKGYKVLFAALSDEENKSAGARELLNSGMKFDNIIIGEPTSTKNIVVEYRGVLHLDIKCSYESQHSSSAQFNPIIDISKKINEISVLPTSYDKPSIVPTIIKAGHAVNVTPSEVYLHYDIRYPYNYDVNTIISLFNEKFSGCQIAVTEKVPPVKVSANDPTVKSLYKGLLLQGIKPSLVKKAGTSDMNILKDIAKSIATYGPGDSKLEHTLGEKITLEEIFIGINTYTKAIEEICSRQY